MVSLTSRPTYPVPGRQVTLTFGGADPSTNFVRLWATSAPVGSPERAALDEAQLAAGDVARVSFHEGDTTESFQRTFEVGGVYTLAAQEYTRGASTYGGGYDGSPDAYPSETKLGSEVTLTIYVGARLVCTIGTRRHGQAQLVVHVWNDAIRATTLREHGEFTPALINPTTDLVRQAAEASTVQAKLDALDAELWSALLGVDDLIADMVGTIGAHFANAAPHDIADTDNTAELSALPSTAASYATTAAIRRAARTVLEAFGRHSSNRDNQGATNDYHADADLLNLAIADAPGEGVSSYLAIADAYLSYEAHRQDTTAHNSADATNTLTAANLSPLMDLFGEFLRLLRGDTGSPPSGEHVATVGLTQGGFRKVPS
jgi:hypothetical protein